MLIFVIDDTFINGKLVPFPISEDILTDDWLASLIMNFQAKVSRLCCQVINYLVASNILYRFPSCRKKSILSWRLLEFNIIFIVENRELL